MHSGRRVCFPAACDTALDHTCPRLTDQPVPQGPLWTLQRDSDGTAAEQGDGHARPPHPTLHRDAQLTANCHTTWGPAARACGSRREALQRSGQRSRAALIPQTPLPRGITHNMTEQNCQESGRGRGVVGDGQGHGQLCEWPAVGGGAPTYMGPVLPRGHSRVPVASHITPPKGTPMPAPHRAKATAGGTAHDRSGEGTGLSPVAGWGHLDRRAPRQAGVQTSDVGMCLLTP